MTISVGDRLPDATFLVLGPDGPEPRQTGALFGAGKSVLIGMPGAFTATCSGKHMPDIVANAGAILAKGVGRLVVVAVNDPFALAAWGAQAGAPAAGIEMLADPEAIFSKAIGMTYSAPDRGLINRSKRYSMIVEDGVVTHFNPEPAGPTCDISGGATLLGQL